MMALGKSCRLRASFLVNLSDLAYAAPARVCIASHAAAAAAAENCPRDALDAGSLLHAALFADVLFALDGLVLGGPLAWAAMLCVLIQPPSPSPRVRGAAQWAAQSGRRGVSSCKEEDSARTMQGLMQCMDGRSGWGPGVGVDTVAVVVVGGVCSEAPGILEMELQSSSQAQLLNG